VTLRRVISAVPVLSCAGFAALLPILLVLPIYPDEPQWRLINARYFLDGGRMLYLFPVCHNGFLNTAPITSYPYWILNSLLYANMSDVYRLRVWGLLTSLLLVMLVASFLPKLVPSTSSLGTRIGIVLSPLSLGMMPFLLSFNRPEQQLLVIICLTIALTVLVRSRPTSPPSWMKWLLAGIYALLATFLMAVHMKGLFLMPALLVAAVAAIRSPLPSAFVGAVASISAWETFVLWRDRTNCPESPFLTQVLRNLSLSPLDLANGIGPFLRSAWQDLLNVSAYWHSIEFLPENQSGWLPNMTYPPTAAERFINQAIPIVVILGFVLVSLGALSALFAWFRKGQAPRFETGLAVCLAGIVPAFASYQITKNFYEASLILPVIGLAVVCALPSLLSLPFAGNISRILLTALALLALVSQCALAARFYAQYSLWSQGKENTYRATAAVARLAAQCGVAANASSSRVLMDLPAYSALWRTREPLFLELFSGWWATGINQQKLLRDRQVSAVVGTCNRIDSNLFPPTVRDEGFCCARLDAGDQSKR
jgi:hypothetical protein